MRPGLVLMGTQAIDDDCNQTGQMLRAALIGPGKGLSPGSDRGDEYSNREVMAAGETVEPSFGGVDQRLGLPSRATLRCEHHEGQSKRIEWPPRA